MMTDFEVGQTVTVWDGYSVYRSAVSQIEKMTTRTITLSNGMKFNDRGKQWGFANSYGGKSIRPYQEGDREAIRRENMIRRLDRVLWRRMTDDDLIKVYEIVKANDT